jgi:energy-coupling factor transport system ATP-binding protein
VDPVVEIHNLTYTYAGARTAALRGVSLEVGAGELVIVAGASGSGKSTLLRAISGLVPHFHGGEIAGRVIVAGMDTREHGPGTLAASVGTLFQDPETQVVMGTPRAELAFPLENRGESAAAVARGVEEAALALGIAHLLDRPTSELSGGELQRVALGAALAGRPALVVLDEPTSQLDPVAGDELIALLRRLNEDSDTTILLAEHRLERCLAAADRVIALKDGEIACDGVPEHFLVWAAAAAPELETPGGRMLGSLGLQPVAGVKRARAALRDRGLLPSSSLAGQPASPERKRGSGVRPVLSFDRAWHELRDGPAILRAVSFGLAAGERVALMGRNGAGKSTLLRHAAGLAKPTRGRVKSSGRVALLLQNPADYLVHETVAREASPAALALVGLQEAGDRHPRELSGGEKQRLALAVVLDPAAAEPAAVVCLDEPTRGLDRAHKQELAALLRELDAGVLVATHDPEFAAAFADRVVLLADGAPVADGPVSEVLAGGTYFATETARILGGAGGALTPEQGAALIGAPEMSAV